MRQPGRDAGPVIGPRVGGEDRPPLDGIGQEHASPTGRAAGRGDPVAPTERVGGGGVVEIGLDVREPDLAVGHDVVEPLHEHLLRDDRQGLERRVLEPGMELAVEGRSRHREPAELRQRTRLMVEQHVTRPTIV